jgi:hypothetical protein
VSIRSRLRTALCCAVLQVGVVIGVPMRPEQIQELMRDLSAPKIARTIPDERENGDSLPPR